MDEIQEAVGQLIGNIQPEALDAAVQPMAEDTFLAADKLPVGGVFLIYFWQGVKAPPAFVAFGELDKVELAAVRALLALIGPQGGIASLPVKVEAVAAYMGKDPV